MDLRFDGGRVLLAMHRGARRDVREASIRWYSLATLPLRVSGWVGWMLRHAFARYGHLCGYCAVAYAFEGTADLRDVCDGFCRRRGRCSRWYSLNSRSGDRCYRWDPGRSPECPPSSFDTRRIGRECVYAGGHCRLWWGDRERDSAAGRGSSPSTSAHCSCCPPASFKEADGDGPARVGQWGSGSGHVCVGPGLHCSDSAWRGLAVLWSGRRPIWSWRGACPVPSCSGHFPHGARCACQPVDVTTGGDSPCLSRGGGIPRRAPAEQLNGLASLTGRQ